jgi:hypothetical protein
MGTGCHRQGPQAARGGRSAVPRWRGDDDEPRRRRQQLGGSGDDEYFTPPKYIALARDVLGVIDLDPASCIEAQKIVQATRYFTKEIDGLKQEWFGKIWLNGPFNRLKAFIEKLIQEYESGRATEAITVTPSNTSAQWFQTAIGAASAVCFPSKNIAFIHKTKGQMGQMPAGQCFMYFGKNIEKFRRRFESIGTIVIPYKPKVAAVSSSEARRLQVVSITALDDWLRKKVA